ncbi:CU044_2847 family protein [Methanothrix soehngenii]|uniref:CU044_2847 family protein n=1 Tax=Methanothrix soehngenii TaxID=2223 RepID=UPI002BB076B8|nr:CU044_2847 family protein [Methanothrix soehngenii]HOS21871.1 CU044_2847 family protein [Methanothrix soehngenii]HPL19895.1 CU044_2847 family protein [Methanothrix soehngenii]
MTRFVPDPDAPILVEFAPSPGMMEVCLLGPDLQKQSAEAVKNAMNTIYNTARQVTDTIDALEVKPSSVDVEFGVTLKGESGALIAKAGVEAAFRVKITWTQHA